MKLWKCVATLVLATSLFGCGKINVDEMREKYGPLPYDFMQQAKATVLPMLKDPDSARFTFPVSPCVGRYLRGGGGWGVYFWVNSKNSFGGYTGNRDWSCLINDGRVRQCNETVQGLVANMCGGGY